ncbi:eCIS core domain-containing protein [Flavihumibacter fluvii]|uniref:eCIS core domain-containing protein n=1 Tax=Flavihumibacter fluvii TaxID=2838157 RepID=UPI001BDDCFA8|nr:DUF4157 domain-containing protein [Flavihumibacter fluvii]ULQ53233.1 DUF4157 domain-containing protein [Flavihumibacter fluvii]
MKPILKHNKIPEQSAKPGRKQQSRMPAVLLPPGDRYEQEADANSTAYVKGLGLPLPLRVSPFTGLAGSGLAGLPIDFLQALEKSEQQGTLLPNALKASMEKAFRTDFSRVRIHSGESAAELNRLIHAKAFAWKEHIYFGADVHDTDPKATRQLLAHELTHTLQQRDSKEGVVQRAIELRPPGRGEASAFDRVQELIDRLNRLSAAIQYELQASDLVYTIVDETSLTNFDRQMQDFIDRETMIPMRLVRGIRTVVGDSFWLGYVDLDDLLASDDLGFQSMFLHFIAERFDVNRYADRIGTEGMLPIDLTTRRFRPFFNHAHEAGHQAQLAHLRDVFNDTAIEFNYEEAKPNGSLHMVFKSKPGKYRVFLVIHRAVRTATNTVPAITGAIIKIRLEDGSWPDVSDFIQQRTAIVQPKLMDGGPSDASERAADKAASDVLAGRKINPGTSGMPTLQQSLQTPNYFDHQLRQYQAAGHPLPADFRNNMESAFGTDFSGIRIHTDSQAVRLNRTIGARAFTVGGDIYFDNGMYQPQAQEGKRLLAHELFHTIQQKGNRAMVQRDLYPGEAYSDDFVPVLSDADSVAGILQDALGLLRRLKGHHFKTIIVATQYGFKVYDINGTQNLQNYKQRKGEPMFPEGVWGMDRGPVFGRLGIRDGKSQVEQRTLDTTIFTAATQKQIKERKNTITLSDFIEIDNKALESQQLLPALVVSTYIYAETTGKGDGVPEEWAKEKVKDIENKIGKKNTGTDKSIYQRDTRQDLKTPDKLVIWERESDGKQFVNVHVTDKIKQEGDNTTATTQSVAIEVNPNDTTEQLQGKIEKATEKMRKDLQEAAAKAEEKSITDAGIPYNESTFLGGKKSEDGLKATKPAYRADISGPETMVKYGTGNYKMALHYEDVSGILINQVLEAYGGAEYTWQVIDITTLCKQVMDKKKAKLEKDIQDLKEGKQVKDEGVLAEENKIDAMAKADAVDKHETVTDLDNVARDASRRVSNIKEDISNTVDDMASPLSSQDGSFEKALRTEVVGSFNLATAPLSAIFSAGGWLVSSIASIFDLSDEVEKEIPFPNREGYYMVRAVAQPRPKGSGDHYSLRMPSVAYKIVTIKEIKDRTIEELKNQEANQKTELLTLAMAYQGTTEESKLAELRLSLEAKVSEMAPLNGKYLQEQADSFARLRVKEGMTDDEKKRIDTIIEILGQGKSADAGYLSTLFGKQIAAKKRQLETLKKNGTPYQIRKVSTELDELERRQYTAATREGEMLAKGKTIVRPNAAFVNEENGQTVPLLIEIAQISSDYSSDGFRMMLSDVGTVSGDTYMAEGKTRQQALANLIKEYANHFPYGRGYLQIRMPEGNPYGSYGETPRCSPHDTAQAGEKLDQLIQVLAIVGMFIPVVGEVVMVAGAVYAAARIMYRIENHTFAWDSAAIMDVLSIIGAVAGGVSKIAGSRLVVANKLFAIVPESEEFGAWVKRLSRFVKVADFVAEGVNNISYMIGSMETVSKYLEIQRAELNGDLTKAEAKHQRLELAKSAMVDQIMQHGQGVADSFFPNGKVAARGEKQAPEPMIEPPPKQPGTAEKPAGGPHVEPHTNAGGTTAFPGKLLAVKEKTSVGELLGDTQGLHGVKEVPVKSNPELTGNETRVSFEDGKVVVEVGPKVTETNLRQHLDTIRVMQRYEGALGYVRQLLSKVGQLIGLGPAFGTKGFVAGLEITKLQNIKSELESIKSNLEKEMARANAKEITALEGQFGDLLSQISAIEKQAKQHEADINSTEAGKDFVAMADTLTDPATKKGLTLDPKQKKALLNEQKGLKSVVEKARERMKAAQEKRRQLENLEHERAKLVRETSPFASKETKQAYDERMQAIIQEINKILDGEFKYERLGDLRAPLEKLAGIENSNRELIYDAEARLKALDVQMNPETYRVPFVCFSGDTLVQTSSGAKRIDTVSAGDWVYTFDEENRNVVLKKVISTHVNRTKHFFHIQVKGSLIKATGGHPFYDPEKKAWIPIKHFSKGMKLFSQQGEQPLLEEISLEEFEEQFTYNLSIDQNHNYFVGTGILVHNVKPVMTSGGAIDTRLGGKQIVYRGVNPKIKGVYIGRTIQGAPARQAEHRNTARNFLLFYNQLAVLVNKEGPGFSDQKQNLLNELNRSIGREPTPYTQEKFISVTNKDKPFFEFMSGVILEPIVIGMVTEEQAKFIEQKNIEIEERQIPEAEKMNRREESKRSFEELENTVKEQLKGTGYCP